jgi:hypothetical protein
VRRQPPSPQLDAARRAAGRGWRCFPCVERDKRPLVDWKDAATTDETQLRRWWSGPWRNANLACVVPPGVVVVDVDPRHRGDATLETLEAAEGNLPNTLTAVTGSGGLHLWFSCPEVDDLRQGAEVLGAGLDTRCATRGFVVLPPSVHPCGGGYLWAKGTRDVAPAPGWLVDRLRRPPRQTTMALPATAGPQRTSRYGTAAMGAELDRLANTAFGRRNHDLHLAACRVGQLVAAGHVQADEAAAALTSAGRRIGLDDSEVTATVRSGLRFGTDNPRGTR